jgi:glycosyltransferase involved in cell wall biosynthesis
VILVDDGSKDSSSQLCDDAISLYSDLNVRVHHQENAGQIAARYKGIDLSHGEYCMFVDADDKLAKNALKNISDGIDKYRTDMVIFNGQIFKDGTLSPLWENYYNECTLLEGVRLKKFRHDVIASDRFNNIWLKAIRREVLMTSPRYNFSRNIRTEEDYVMQLPIFDSIKSALYIPKALYYYRDNENSITHHFDPFKFEGSKLVFHEQIIYGKKWDVDDYKVIANRHFINNVGSAVRQLKDIEERVPLNEKISYLKDIKKDKLFQQQFKQNDGSINSNVARFALWLLYHGCVILSLIVIELDPRIHE